jgi:hypothetical protein
MEIAAKKRGHPCPGILLYIINPAKIIKARHGRFIMNIFPIKYVLKNAPLWQEALPDGES